MEQDLSELTKEFRRTNENQEKLLGLFQTMAKRTALNDTHRARGTGSQYGGGYDQDVGDFKKALKQSGKVDEWLRPSVGAVSASFKLLNKDVSHATGAFQGLAKMLLGVVIGGEIIGGIAHYTTGLVSTYKDLAEYGQTFTDGIFGMAKAALAGSMSLDEYARMAKRNSAVMSQMGDKGPGSGLAALSASVRKSAKESGQFGFTIAGLNDVVGDYMETQRIQGRLDKITNKDASDNIKGLAGDTSALSAVFGKSRKDILEATNAALRSVSMTTVYGTMSIEKAKTQGPAIERAMAGLAAQVGDAGKLFPQFLADTLAFEGREWNSEIGKTIAHVLPSATGAMSELAAKLKDASPDEALGLQNEYVKKFKGEVERNMDMLKILHESGGEAGREADQILKMYQGMKVLDPKELATAKKKVAQQDAFTKMMSNLEQNWTEMTTGFLTKLFPLFEKPLQAIGEAFSRFENSGGAGELLTYLKQLGDKVGAFVTGLTDPKNMKAMTDGIETGLNTLTTLFTSLGSADPQQISASIAGIQEAGTWIGKIAWESLVESVKVVSGAILWVRDHLTALGVGLVAVVGVIGALKAAGMALQAYSMIKNIGRMSVDAKNVFVNGRSMSGGGGFDHGGDKGNKRGGKRGWFGKAAAAVGLAAGGSEIAEAVVDAIDEKTKANPTEAADGKPAEAKGEAGKPGAPAEAGGVKGWFKGLLGGFTGNGILGGAMHGLGLASAGYDLYSGGKEAKDAWDEYQKSGDGAKFTKSLIETVVPRAVGWAGAAVGAAAGTAGGAWSGPGAVATGFVGGGLGYSAGSWAGDGVAKDLGKLVDYFTKPSSPTNAPTPAPGSAPSPAVVSDAQAREIQTAQVSVIERLQNLERQVQPDDPNARKMLELIQQLVDQAKEGTGVNAAFLQKVAETISTGNRRVVNTIASQGR